MREQIYNTMANLRTNRRKNYQAKVTKSLPNTNVIICEEAASTITDVSTRRSVSFNLDHNQEHEHEHEQIILDVDDEVEEEVVSDTWFSSEDFQSFRQDKDMCVQKLLDAQQQTAGHPLSFERVVTKAYEACSRHVLVGEAAATEPTELLTPFEAMHLMKCMDMDVLGMTTAVINQLSAETGVRRRTLYRAIAKAQRYHGNDCEIICRESERFSTSARLFARIMATALAGSVAIESQERRLTSV
jgi:hypothetical protein